MKQPNYNIIVGHQLRKLREIKSITQTDIAEIIGVGKNTISQYENGVRRINVDSLCKIADEFDLPLDWFTGRNTDINKKLKD